MSDSRWRILYLVLILLSMAYWITAILLKLPSGSGRDYIVTCVAAMAIQGFTTGSLVFAVIYGGTRQGADLWANWVKRKDRDNSDKQ